MNAKVPRKGMRIAAFTHSLVSDWNHGNAHFIRGVLRELVARGHHVRAWEPADGWSRANAIGDHGAEALSGFGRAFPDLVSTTYPRGFDPAEAVADVDLVLVHEWTDPAIIARLGRLRAAGAGFILLFHDTDHRAVSDPDGLRAHDLSAFDGVLAFGATLAEFYRRWGWGNRVYVWHQAADISLFHPPETELPREGVVWIGNWGDGERGAELRDYLLAPARAAGLALDVHGVRYPEDARHMLTAHGARYHGWLPNAEAPGIYARHLATVHVPRRFYVRGLAGIPTTRVFEALACGIPLVSAPWSDVEGLFRPGQDFLFARDGAEMERHLRAIAADPALRADLVQSGLATIRARHTCRHRVDDLLGIVAKLTLADAPRSGPHLRTGSD